MPCSFLCPQSMVAFERPYACTFHGGTETRWAPVLYYLANPPKWWGKEGKVPTQSFFFVVSSKIPRKTSKMSRICLTLRTPKKPRKIQRKRSKRPRKFPARKAPRKQKHQGKEGQGKEEKARCAFLQTILSGKCAGITVTLVLFTQRRLHRLQCMSEPLFQTKTLCVGRREKTPTPKTRFSMWTSLRTPGRLTTRPLPVYFTTKMSVVRPTLVLGKAEIG